MRLISDRSTFMVKRVFPIVWFGLLAFILVAMLYRALERQDFPIPVLVVPFAIGAFGYQLMRKLLFDLVDQVWDAGDALVIRNAGREVRVPLSEIMNISCSSFTNSERVTLSIRRDTVFGTEIAFTPATGFTPFSRSPIVDELIRRVDAARQAR